MGREEGDPRWPYHYYEQEAERQRAFAEDRTVHMRARANCNRFISITGHEIVVGSDGTIWLTELDARSARSAGFADIP